MLPVLLKLLERFVASQLWVHISQHDLLPKEQSVYHRHHSTETSLLRTLYHLHTVMDKGQLSLVASLDLTRFSVLRRLSSITTAPLSTPSNDNKMFYMRLPV